MIATDVASRGLDIPTVATVVHYDVARAVGTFVHRAGRTAVSFYPCPVLIRVDHNFRTADSDNLGVVT